MSERPEVMIGNTHKVRLSCGTMYITVNKQDGKFVEVFVQLGKVGGCASAQLEALARVTSLALKSGSTLQELSHQLKDIRCPEPNVSKGVPYRSCADAIAKVLEREIKRAKLSKEQT